MKEKMTFGLKEAAEVCGVSTHTMQALVNRQDFPALRVGRRWMIPRDSLEEWLKQQAAKRRSFETTQG